MTERLTLTAAADRSLAWVEGDSVRYVVATLAAARPEAMARAPAPPVHLALVIDVSGSMAGEKLEQAKSAALGVSEAILEAAALGFLGLGAQPPIPEWGSMLADSREFIRSNPWIVTLPGLAILVTVISINLMGDGLRDALDPKLKRS